MDIEDEDYGWHVKSVSTNYNGGHRKTPIREHKKRIIYDLRYHENYEYKNGESLVSGFELNNYGRQFWEYDYGILVRFIFR